MGVVKKIALLLGVVFLGFVVFSPLVTFHVIMLLDFFTPFSAFESPIVARYHEYLVSQLPDQDEIPLPELHAHNITREAFYEASKGYTFPTVVRGMLKDLDALKKWNNASWWASEYGDEEVLCKYVNQISDGDAPSCTVKSSFGSPDGSNRMYISGESRLFIRRPELQNMIESEKVDAIAPGRAVFTQLFMGYSDMGSDVHAAVGCNLFRQIVGRKKWWLIPVSQTPYVYPSLNPNGFSAHSKTKIGKGNEEPSPFLKKIQRYTVTLEPGDLLLNPAWFWHGIKNLGDDPHNDLVIGVPTRYAIKNFKPAIINNPLLTTIAMSSIAYTYGIDKFLSSADSLQKGIERARTSRAKELSAKDEELERALA